MRIRRLLPLLAGVLVLAAPAPGQGTDRGSPPPAGGRTRGGEPADPQRDPVITAITGAVKPNQPQMERIVSLLGQLRQQQVDVRRQSMRIARGQDPGTEPDRQKMQEAAAAAQKRIDELNQQFLADCRAVLQPDQYQAWDTLAPTLDLAPPRGGRQRGQRDEVRGPAEGTAAPDFELADIRGERVSLSSLRGRPVVLEFGSYTCPAFRGSSRELEALQKEYGDAVAWVLVYTLEAHPGEGKPQAENAREGIQVPQHKSYEARLESAKTCAARMDLKLRVLVDGFDNKVTELYAGWPNRGYVIDAHGTIVSRQGGIDPERTREVLEHLRRGETVPPPARK